MRLQLLDVAAKLFAERGYEAVSMRDIAKVVGVTQANLYYHFRGKADLIEATLAHVFEDRAERLEAWLAGHPHDPLGAFVLWLVGALKTDHIFARLLHRELLDGDANRIDTLSRTVLQRPYRALVDAVAALGESAPADATALSLIGFVLGQMLVLPLAPGLLGVTAGAETDAALAARLLALVRPSIVKA